VKIDGAKYPIYKIASFELVDDELIRNCARTRKLINISVRTANPYILISDRS